MEQPSKSEIARFREQQRLQEESARLALSGLTYTASHFYINARMERIALCMQQRGAQVGMERAVQEANAALNALREELACKKEDEK